MEYLECNSQITVNGLKHAGIHQALGLLDNDDDVLHYSFDEESSEEDENTSLHVSDVYSDAESDGEFS